MRQRLTIALVGVALASVLLVGAGVLILAQIGAREQATNEAIEQVDVLTDFVSDSFQLGGRQQDRPRRPRVALPLQRLGPALGFVETGLVVIRPNGEASTIDERFFAVAEQEGSSVPLTPLTELDGEQMAILAGGEAVVLDPDDLADDSPLGRSDRTVIVLQIIPSDIEQPSGQLAVVGRHPVVTFDRDAQLWFVVSALAVLLGAAVVSIVLARRFSKPITQIERATAAVAAGDFTARIEVDGDDELAQLGGSVNEMAAALERSQTLDQQFLMSVSHDLRTPLTAITGYGEALRDGAIDDPRAAGEVIGNQANRLERLVGDLLDLARLDANRFQLHPQDADVAVVVGRTVAGLQPEAEKHGLSCRFENGGPAVATVDPDRLGQAVANLIDNAIKHASSTITASATVDVHEASITVIDDGPGIAPADLPHVFERLYVSRHQPARAENPSGMGLAIVRELTLAMGGAVSAAPGPVSGTAMTIRLPLTTSSHSPSL
ncbi:MAG: sensor histidine kinase [Acidimicrobiales bacterium]